MEALIQPGHRLAYMLAGHATLTIVGRERRYTYKISRAPKNPFKLWVSVLNGSENTQDYKFMGTIMLKQNGEFHRFYVSNKGPIAPDAPSAVALAWIMRHPEDARMQVYHSGRCGKCGRKLTTPESILTGLGPTCSARASAARVEPAKPTSPRRCVHGTNPPESCEHCSRQARNGRIAGPADAGSFSAHMIGVAFKHTGEFA